MSQNVTMTVVCCNFQFAAKRLCKIVELSFSCQAKTRKTTRPRAL